MIGWYLAFAFSFLRRRPKTKLPRCKLRNPNKIQIYLTIVQYSVSHLNKIIFGRLSPKRVHHPVKFILIRRIPTWYTWPTRISHRATSYKMYFLRWSEPSVVRWPTKYAKRIMYPLSRCCNRLRVCRRMVSINFIILLDINPNAWKWKHSLVIIETHPARIKLSSYTYYWSTHCSSSVFLFLACQYSKTFMYFIRNVLYLICSLKHTKYI